MADHSIIESEEWRPSHYWPGYEISSHGRFRNKETGTIRKTKGLYPHITMTKGRTVRINREVCAAFHGVPLLPSYVARHLDGDPTNNHYKNLAWGTQRENMRDKERHGTLLYGENHPGAKLTDAQARRATKIYKRIKGTNRRAPNGLLVALGKKFGVNKYVISNIVRGFAWKRLHGN